MAHRVGSYMIRTGLFLEKTILFFLLSACGGFPASTQSTATTTALTTTITTAVTTTSTMPTTASTTTTASTLPAIAYSFSLSGTGGSTPAFATAYTISDIQTDTRLLITLQALSPATIYNGSTPTGGSVAFNCIETLVQVGTRGASLLLSTTGATDTGACSEAQTKGTADFSSFLTSGHTATSIVVSMLSYDSCHSTYPSFYLDPNVYVNCSMGPVWFSNRIRFSAAVQTNQTN